MKPTDLHKIAEKLPLSNTVMRLNQDGPTNEQDRLAIVEFRHLKKKLDDAYYMSPTGLKSIKKPNPRMNKLELRFYEILIDRSPMDSIVTPQFRLRISDVFAPVQVHYTADFMVSHKHEECWWHVLWECKDSRRNPHSDELTRPKMALQHNPWISEVILATWDGVNWTERRIA